MLSTLIPKRINRGLNLNNISVGDGPFSDGNGQHTNCITERAQGRQAKMKKVEIIWVGRNLTVKLVKIWVETIDYGLKIGEFSTFWTY